MMENSNTSVATVNSLNLNNNNNGSEAGPGQTILARAVYDNCAEVAQELSFSRGDVLTVLKKDPPGFEGWWICSLAGKVGIAPGNRLELLGAVTVSVQLFHSLHCLRLFFRK